MHHFAHVVSFLLGWQASVYGAAHDWPFLGPLVIGGLLVLHCARLPDSARRLRLISVVALLGTLVESTSIAGGLYVPAGTFRGPLCPLWMTAWWLNLALLVDGALRPLAGRFRAMVAVLGALLLPLGYVAAAWLGAITVLWHPLPAIILWALFGAAGSPILWGLVVSQAFRVPAAPAGKSGH